MKSFYLLDLAYSGAPELLHHCESHSQGHIKRFRDTIEMPTEDGIWCVSSMSPAVTSDIPSDIPLRRIGIMLREPAVRLAAAYLARKKVGNFHESFVEYYQHEARRNRYSVLLSNYPVEKLGFTGIFERYNSSLHFASEWLQFKPGFRHALPAQNHELDIASLLTNEVVSDIKRYNTLDYSIYQNALDKIRNNACDAAALSLNSDKRIVIHLGPPKTGTSAIQSWLMSHKRELSEARIYYPEHNFDTNNISSGNFLSVMSKDSQTSLYHIDANKLMRLVSDFNHSPHRTLLLSSEHFYFHIVRLFKLLPHAQYLFYIRHPLSLLESSYHQDVKRHKQTKPFIIPNQIGFSALKAFLFICKELDIKPTLRFYDRPLVKNGSLINDFCSAANIDDVKVNVADRIVNSKLDFGELELMRICNRFLDQDSLVQLDAILQKLSCNSEDYSLVSKQGLDSIRAIIDENLHELSAQGVINNHDSLQHKLTQLAAMDFRLPYRDQKCSIQYVAESWTNLKKANIRLSKHIKDVYKNTCLDNDTIATVFDFPWSKRDDLRYAASRLLFWQN